MTIRERWKVVPGFPRYEVSDQGRVRSNWPFHPKRALKPATMNRFGHVSVSLSNGKVKRRSYCVHYLVLLAFVGPRPKKHDCCHKNGIGSDNRLKNLMYGTRSENNIQSSKKGTKRRKLTEEQVGRVKRSLGNAGMKQRFAEEYGVARNTIENIYSGRTYTWVRT